MGPIEMYCRFLYVPMDLNGKLFASQTEFYIISILFVESDTWQCQSPSIVTKTV